MVTQPISISTNTELENSSQKVIYLAGGCFWGLEAYMKRIPGVLAVTSGYANGNTANPSYEEVCQNNTGHAETVKVEYDNNSISLRHLLIYYMRVIDPTSLNKQGNDVGTQYRTGIFYVDLDDLPIIEEFLRGETLKYNKKLRIQVEPLTEFYVAEEYHQDYLDKNPNGYCHIDMTKVQEPIIDEDNYKAKTSEELKNILTEEEYRVTQEAGTDYPHSHPYDQKFEKGIYVDITTGEPLFVSTTKFDAGCGWPSFSKPINSEVVNYYRDSSLGMERIEVRSRIGHAHLGHVFTDGPQKLGGLRYCINGSSLRFISEKDMDQEGYGDLKYLLEK